MTDTIELIERMKEYGRIHVWDIFDEAAAELERLTQLVERGIVLMQANSELIARLHAENKRFPLARKTFANGMNQIIAMWPCSQTTVEDIRNETIDKVDALMSHD